MRRRKMKDERWISTSELYYVDFVRKGMVKHLPQFQVPELQPGEKPPLTPNEWVRDRLQKPPCEVAQELMARTYLSDIFCKKPPPENYWETLLQHAKPPQKMLEGDTRPRWRW